MSLTLLTLLAALGAPQTDLEHLDAEVEVRVIGDRPRIEGVAAWRMTLGDPAEAWIDALDFEFRAVEAELLPEAGPARPIPVNWGASREGIRLKPKAPPGARVRITLRYAVTPSKWVGLERPEGATPILWSGFQTWAWLPAPIAIHQRATLALELRAPDLPEAVILATGDGPERPGPDVASEIPHPSYLWGFAIGPFRPAWLDSAGEGALPQVLWSLDPAHPGVGLTLDRTQGAWARWIAAGMPWPQGPDPYTQVAFEGAPPQELAGMTLLPARHLRGLVEAPEEDWLIVHELGHQLWGNRVTCATWGDFWINEAVMVWWVAMDRAQRGDKAGYAREALLWMKRARRALERGDDKRVHRPGIDVGRAGGPIPYNAGARLIAEIAARRGRPALIEALAQIGARALERGALSLSTPAFLDEIAPDPDLRAWLDARLSDATRLFEEGAVPSR